MEAVPTNHIATDHSALPLRRRRRRRRPLARASKRVRNPSEHIRAKGEDSPPPLANRSALEAEDSANAPPPAPWRAPDPRGLAYGIVSLMGRRRNMEDAAAAVTGLAAGPHGYFAVYDGHGGAMVAQKCCNRLHVAVEDEVRRRAVAEDGEGVEAWKRAMVAGFARVDAEVMAETRELQMGLVGSTAVVAVVTEKWIIVANCGDSRAVLFRGGVAMPMSSDHKPDRPDELRRVEALGGKVLYWDCPRVLGVLATSRSFGDYFLKPFVSSEPEFAVIERSDEDQFLILASDGLWDVMSNGMVCRVVKKCLEEKPSDSDNAALDGVSHSAVRDAAGLLARLAICQGSDDNVTVLLVVF
ncbi:protein phosphatase 2C 51-like [Zingiber officinale]|uniref:protein-serine/threonine phosphatase n=1 Tax=Zingiber officinale TaxID=94328 RepID=A0A8J5I4R3_ZINOF|nr:protein phosphatase 2C 51-like [Zingiber officinale]KAG6527890.1 hypothetical protein ZIOFF_010024 [Zingiber officinale]